MVGFKTLPKLCVVVAFGYSATVRSTGVAQEQSKKESFVSTFISKGDETTTEPLEVPETQPGEPPRYSVEWYLLPKPESRKELRKQLPWYLAKVVPEDCNVSITPQLGKRIRRYFSVCSVEWYFLPEPVCRTALRNSLPTYLAAMVPEDCSKPIMSMVEKRIRKFLSLSQDEQR
ncbi:SmORF protein [Babesia bovis T2Bo]|uniref:SmORF protein n=1 Tax=Babesia bovis T2Bo TaxID=484906 RepID=UPI001C369A8F|nr:SmORF protein [Babesia bovis T2Bo]KAG6440165.1 SmORF protein [Babesia bovis T2Bo]